jgi:hypothetical protein
MPRELVLAVGVLAAIDAALRAWRPRSQALSSGVYLALAYGPIVALPYAGSMTLTITSAAVALGAMFSMCRMVGLTLHLGFFIPAVLATLAFYVAASIGWYDLYQAMPAFAVFGVLVSATLHQQPEALLQKLCLSWLALLVYGYLWGHTVLFTLTPMRGLSGPFWVALLVLCAKFADVAWVLAGLAGPRVWVKLWVQPLGGLLGGCLVSYWIHALDLAHFAAWGALIGFGNGWASEAFNRIVVDVAGGKDEQPLKASMLFGFAFAAALAFHLLRHWS